MPRPNSERRWEDGAVSIAALVVMFLLAAAWLYEHLGRRAEADRLAAVSRRLLVRLDAPSDGAQFDLRANVPINGEIFLPPEWGDGATLQLQARLYRPLGNTLNLVNESPGELAPVHSGVAPFTANIRRPRVGSEAPPGKYLLRVDCLDQLGVVLASQAVFIEFIDVGAASP